MKTRILAITLFVIGAFMACKKVGENFVNTKYTDKELNIDINSSFAEEERKIKEGIMGFQHYLKQIGKAIVRGIIMDNKFVARIENHTMPIFEKLSKQNVLNLYKIIIPNKAFKIIDDGKTIVEFNPTPQWAPCDYYISYWHKRYVTCYVAGCGGPGSDQCMCYVPCNFTNENNETK